MTGRCHFQPLADAPASSPDTVSLATPPSSSFLDSDARHFVQFAFETFALRPVKGRIELRAELPNREVGLGARRRLRNDWDREGEAIAVQVGFGSCEVNSTLFFDHQSNFVNWDPYYALFDDLHAGWYSL